MALSSSSETRISRRFLLSEPILPSPIHVRAAWISARVTGSGVEAVKLGAILGAVGVQTSPNEVISLGETGFEARPFNPGVARSSRARPTNDSEELADRWPSITRSLWPKYARALLGAGVFNPLYLVPYKLWREVCVTLGRLDAGMS